MDSLAAIFYPFGHAMPYAYGKSKTLRKSLQNYFWFLFLEATAILYYSMQIGIIS
jgi:hypothetical protein